MMFEISIVSARLNGVDRRAGAGMARALSGGEISSASSDGEYIKLSSVCNDALARA